MDSHIDFNNQNLFDDTSILTLHSSKPTLPLQALTCTCRATQCTQSGIPTYILVYTYMHVDYMTGRTLALEDASV